LIKLACGNNKDKNDFVTEIDRSAEEAVIGILRKAYPDHSFLGEESGGEHKPNETALERVRKLNPAVEPVSDDEWVIDPLDGTTNLQSFFYRLADFIHCVPHATEL